MQFLQLLSPIRLIALMLLPYKVDEIRYFYGVSPIPEIDTSPPTSVGSISFNIVVTGLLVFYIRARKHIYAIEYLGSNYW